MLTRFQPPQGLGFLSIAGDAKVQLTSKWSEPPTETASLLAVASRKGLVAAAGPDGLTVATTDSVRKAFGVPKQGESEVRPFQPQIKLPLPLRVSQLAFTADERYLVVSAESGGGLAVYDVQELNAGASKATFELSTNGEALRAVVPNPAPEAAELCAVVTNNGNLLMANFKERKLVSTPNGQFLKTQVSSVAWSNKGKQLVAGLADGSIHQMTPAGEVKGIIPKPAGLGDYYGKRPFACSFGYMLTQILVTSIVWLENNVFLVAYNTTGGEHTSTYHLITRNTKPALSFVFQKLSDPAENFGDKTPHLSIMRLRDFPPNIQDVLLVSSSAAESIGLVTRSKTPLASGAPAEVFTTTELADDSKRANLPLGADFNETYPIGTALDLSSKEKVPKPIPTDEMDESPGPLPGLWVLNNEGVLSSWWVVYNESIRQGTTYPGLLASEESAPEAVATPKSTAFGAPSSTPAFGGASTLGTSQSPWGAAAQSSSTPSAGATFGSNAFGGEAASSGPKFGAPTFGASSFGAPSGPSFGQSSTMGLGMRTSPWGASSAAAATPAFGKSSFGTAATPSVNPFASKGDAAASPFASVNAPSPASGGGFAGFASKGGFASAASGSPGGSIFGSAKPSGSFGSDAPGGSTIGGTAFPPPKAGTAPGFGSSPFVLGTTFKADAATANDNEAPRPGGSSLFGSGFGLSLGDSAAANESKDEDMDAITPAAAEAPKAKSMFESTTPTTTPAPSKFFNVTSGGPPQTGLFGFKAPSTLGTASKGPAELSLVPRHNADAKPAVHESRQEPPLPPDTISKAVYLLGESSSSSGSAPSPEATSKMPSNKTVDDTPLPPDPWAMPKSKKAQTDDLPPLPGVANKVRAPLPESAPLPPDPAKIPVASLPPDPWSKPTAAATAPKDAPLPPLPGAAGKGAPTTRAGLIPSVFDAPFKIGASDSGASNPFANMKPPTAETTPEGSDLSGDEGDEEGDEEEQEEGEEAQEEGEEEQEEGEDEQEEGEIGEEDAEGQEDDGSEGSGIDVAGDLSPATTTGFGQTPGFTPQSSFAGMAGSNFSLTSRPDERQLFGEGRRAPQFPQPTQLSPQSPSPTRKNAPRPAQYQVLRSESSRSVSAPGYASQILGSKPLAPSTGRPIPGRTPLARDANVEEQRKAVARKEADEARVLVDDQYEMIERQLDAPIEPTLQLPECTWLVGTEVQGGSSIASQNEAVYRDINRMIQTLKANARNLSAYIAGHMGQGRAEQPPKGKQDLESLDDWLLCDIDQCGDVLTEDLQRELDDARAKDGDETRQACADLLKEVARLRALRDDVQRVYASQTDPEQVATGRALPLSAEQAAQQKDLRRAFTAVSQRAAEVERDLTQLKAKLVSLGAGGRAGAPVPTVDAVLRTITRMTSMAEKRSGDVDVLENQMRRLGISGGGGAAAASRDGTPFTPPASKRASVFSPGASQRSLASSVASNGGARATPPRKKLSGYSEREKAAARQQVDGRQRTLLGLRAALEQKGPIYMAMDEE